MAEPAKNGHNAPLGARLERTGIVNGAKIAWGRAWFGRSYDLGRMNLRDLVFAYAGYPAIQAYFVLAVLSGAYAIYAAVHWLPVLAAAAAAAAAYPLAWYLIHRFILHGRWLYRMKWAAALWKRIHFDHHQDPHKLDVLFGSLTNTLPTIAAVTLPIGYLIGGFAGAAAALSSGLLTTCIYEFCHCIQHLNYKPKSRFMLRMKQLHLAHHFHDETGNFGIVSFFPDVLLGTYYASPRDRARSPNVFHLGYSREEAQRYPWVMELTGAPPRDRPAPAFEATANTALPSEREMPS